MKFPHQEDCFCFITLLAITNHRYVTKPLYLTPEHCGCVKQTKQNHIVICIYKTKNLNMPTSLQLRESLQTHHLADWRKTSPQQGAWKDYTSLVKYAGYSWSPVSKFLSVYEQNVWVDLGRCQSIRTETKNWTTSQIKIKSAGTGVICHYLK